MTSRRFAFTDTRADRLRVTLWLAGAFILGAGLNCLAAAWIAAGQEFF